MPWLDENVKPADLAPPQRDPDPKKAYGQKGRPIRLIANHFETRFKNIKDLILTQYDVAIFKGNDQQEAGLSKSYNVDIFEAFKSSYKNLFRSIDLAYDAQKSAYSVGTNHEFDNKQSFKVEVEGKVSKKKTSFRVTVVVVSLTSIQNLFETFKYVKGQKQSIPSTPLQMLEVLFKYYHAQNFVVIGRNNFFPTNQMFGNNYDIGGGKEGVMGFFGSLRPASWKNGSILLNLDVAHTAFHKNISVIEYLVENMIIRGEGDLRQPLREDSRRNAKKLLSKLKIYTTHSPIKRTYKVTDVLPRSAEGHTFSVDGKTMSIVQYFKSQYKYQVKYPKFNILKVGPVNKDICVPLEVCIIMQGQKVQGKLDSKETANFIRSTAVPPQKRLQNISNIHKQVNYSSTPAGKALGFTVSDMPLRLDGKQLPPPDITMGSETFKPRDGVWDDRNKVYHSARNLQSWVVVNFDFRTYDDNVRKFVGMLIRMGGEKGMKVGQPEIITEKNPRFPDIFMNIKRRYKDIQMVLCIVSRQTELYSKIKHCGDTQVQIITQCVQGMNVQKCQPQTVGNILRKINTKLEGVNQIIGRDSQVMVFQRPVIIMGADVNHPAPGNTSLPSLVAVVASIDKFAYSYAVEVRPQSHRTEVIVDMKDITVRLLKQFRNKLNVPPERIIMYRDGVSESQFHEVLVSEMLAIRKACTFLSANYKPAITFICVQKRHHTRLFCENDRDAVGKSRNVPPGTTVDSIITHPTERDFFLVSHAGIQGTSKPTHYHILWDDSDFDMTMLQQLTYCLCHVYSRCSRSVSIPTPVYYAHLAAERAKVHLASQISDTSSVSTRSSEEEQPLSQSVARNLTNTEHFIGRLYFI